MSNSIEYILHEIELRGYNDNLYDCNDFTDLIHKKDFKNLIALEIYEVYFWMDRHEFDLQLLHEIVESVEAFFSDPDTILQIRTGLLQNLPSAIIVAAVSSIWKRFKLIGEKRGYHSEKNSSWKRIERNIKKIDTELNNHDYILTDEIEKIFDATREEIQPLLKLCGCKCFIDKKKSIWIKPGLCADRVKEILKNYNIRKR